MPAVVELLAARAPARGLALARAAVLRHGPLGAVRAGGVVGSRGLRRSAGPQAYLGTQGDEWDAQKDMALASLGGALLIVLGARGRLRPPARRRRPEPGRGDATTAAGRWGERAAPEGATPPWTRPSSPSPPASHRGPTALPPHAPVRACILARWDAYDPASPHARRSIPAYSAIPRSAHWPCSVCCASTSPSCSPARFPQDYCSEAFARHLLLAGLVAAFAPGTYAVLQGATAASP